MAIDQKQAVATYLQHYGATGYQVLAVETERNAQRLGIAWQFTTRDARRKLKRLYPVQEPSTD